MNYNVYDESNNNLTQEIINWIDNIITTNEDRLKLKNDLINAIEYDKNHKYFIFLIYKNDWSKVINIFVENTESVLDSIDMFQMQNNRIYRLYKIDSKLIIKTIDERLKEDNN